MTALAACCTGTNTPPEQHGWHFRQVQGRMVAAAVALLLVVALTLVGAARRLAEYH